MAFFSCFILFIKVPGHPMSPVAPGNLAKGGSAARPSVATDPR